MGGLLAARALSETFAEVVLVDRDVLPQTAASRRGVPQDRQLHVLLARGREALDELFPGLTDELIALGVPLVDLHGQVDWVNDGHLMLKSPSTMHAFGIGRPLLENVVRARVLALPGVALIAGCEVTGLLTSPDRRRVTGVSVQERGEGTAPRDLRADFVIDTSGRGSRMPVWLEQLGYPVVSQERVHVGVTYVTRMYHREPGQIGGLLGVVTNAMPGLPRSGVVAAQEGDRFAVALCGMLDEVPPSDDAGMATFAGKLPAPQFAEVVAGSVPTSEPVTMRFPASQRRHYEKLRRFPDGLLVMGDAMCSFNPVYGQGMTVAALQALLLRRVIADGNRNGNASGEGNRTHAIAHRFFKGAAKLIDAPWSISVGSDLRFPAVEGKRTPRVRLVNAYVSRLHAAATADPVLGEAFIRVINLIDPPTRLLAPRIVRRVLGGARPKPRTATREAALQP